MRQNLNSNGADSALNRRFNFGILTVIAMLLGRVLWSITGYSLFDTITIMAAGLVPLAILVLCEALLLRHAPRALKFFAAGGAGLFAISAFMSPQFADPFRLICLLIFQSIVFLSVGYLIVSRDKASLSVAENKTVERLGLSLVLILPFAISDFRTDLFDTPVRLSGIAILFMCWLAISFGRGNLSHSEIMRSFVMLSVSAFAAGIAITLLAGFDIRTAIQTIAVIVAATTLASIYNEGKTTQRDGERDSLLRYLAEGNIDHSDDFLRGLQNHSLVEGALILHEEDLTDFEGSFGDCFDGQSIRRRSDIATSPNESHDQQMAWFFEKYDSSHAMLVRETPLTVVALNMPTLAASPGAEVELRAIQRMAFLLSAKSMTS